MQIKKSFSFSEKEQNGAKKSAKRKADDNDSGVDEEDLDFDSDLDIENKIQLLNKLKQQRDKKKKDRHDAWVKKNQASQSDDSEEESEGESSSSSDSESDDELYRQMAAAGVAGGDNEGDLTSSRELKRQRKQAILNRKNKDGFEIVSAQETGDFLFHFYSFISIELILVWKIRICKMTLVYLLPYNHINVRILIQEPLHLELLKE